MRYIRGELSGVFDFDNTHVDLRVADFALSWRGRHDGVIEGYEQESSLEPIDRELLVPVYRAWVIASAVKAIEEGNAPRWAVIHLRRQPDESR
jgi:Ser/Thr protein kinase RdoA (MazF antagonist)